MAREKRESRWNWQPWLMAGAGAALFLATGFAALEARQYALRDPQFRLDPEKPGALTVAGLQYASRMRVMRVFEADFGRSIFAVSLAERRRRLLAIDWIEDATVSRLWPDRLAVSVKERKPVAFVNLAVAAGVTRVLLIDASGLLLEPPPQSNFSFPVLSGITEAQSEAERRARVKAMLRLAGELGPAAQEISEINAADPDNLRLVTQVDGRPVELMMGDGNYGRRYHAFLEHYQEIRKRSETTVTFDLRLDDRITARD